MKTTTFNWTRLLRTLVALMVIMAMLLCGCASANKGDEGSDGDNGGGSDNGGVLGGDGDGKLETEDVVGGVASIYGTLLEAIGGKNNSLTNGGYSIDMTVTLGDEVMDSLAATLEQGGLDADLSWFKSLGIVMEVLYNEHLAEMNLEAKLNGTGIVSMEAIVDMMNSAVYMRLPELNDEYVGGTVDMGYDAEEYLEAYNQMLEMMEEYGDIVNSLPTEKELDALLNRYIGVVKEAMADPDTTTEKLTIGGVSQSVTATTYTITRTDLLNILEAVLNAAKSDAELEKIIDELMTWINEEAAKQDPNWEEVDLHAQMVEAIEEFLPQIEELREELKSGEVEDIDMFSYTIYTADDKQVGIALTENNGYDTLTMSVISLENDGKTAFAMDLAGQVVFNGTGTIDGNKASGEYDLTVSGEDILHLTVKDFDTAALKKGDLKGTLQLRLSDELLREMGGIMTANTVIELVMDMGNGKAELGVNLYDGEDLIIGLALTTKTVSGNVSVPSDYTDMESSSAMQNWVNGMSFDTILRNLRSAGVSDDLMDMLEQAIEGSFGG